MIVSVNVSKEYNDVKEGLNEIDPVINVSKYICELIRKDMKTNPMFKSGLKNFVFNCIEEYIQLNKLEINNNSDQKEIDIGRVADSFDFD